MHGVPRCVAAGGKLLLAATTVVGASLAIEHGPDFFEAATAASLPAAFGMAAHQTIYVKLAQRFQTAWSLAGGFGAWAASTLAMRALGLGFGAAAVMAVTGLAVLAGRFAGPGVAGWASSGTSGCCSVGVGGRNGSQAAPRIC